MRLKWKLIIASLKMYFRQKEAIIWSILLPLFMIVLFGFVKFGGVGHIHLGVINEAGEKSAKLLTVLRNVRTLEVTEGTRESEVQELEKGEREMVLFIPPSYDPTRAGSLIAYTNDAKPQETQLAALVMQRVLDELAFEQSPPTSRLTLKTQSVKSRNLTYIDFLLPGVISMSIMQMGIFGVAFGFVSLKKRGILRRLWVTPISPSDFILAQVVTRLIVLLMQMSLMIAVGIFFFHLHFIGNILNVFIIGMLGAVVFLAMGYALAGISKSEDQVAPMANILALPMMLLSGIFFSRNNLPGLVHTITSFFPLTYLADGMRSIAIDGATLAQVGPQIAGLAVWCVVSVFLAVKMFRWE